MGVYPTNINFVPQNTYFSGISQVSCFNAFLRSLTLGLLLQYNTSQTNFGYFSHLSNIVGVLYVVRCSNVGLDLSLVDGYEVTKAALVLATVPLAC